MVNTNLMDGSYVRSSKPTCLEHLVEWEASALVEVTLTRQAGALPVEEVSFLDCACLSALRTDTCNRNYSDHHFLGPW